ncbi:MAG: winged helix-turn-helix domain-containing protein [Candidatus Zixiibacteriota bacterium]
MKEIIGLTAGKIWTMLKKKNEVSLSQLPKVVNEKQVIVYQALGWLAREDKIEYITKGKATMVTLHK